MKIASLLTLLALLVPVLPSPAENIVFPPDAGHVDVTKPPYNLKGDGSTDCTAGLQQAFVDVMGKNQTLYFPNGTYLIADSVGVFDAKAHSKTRFVNLQGQSQAGAIIRLKDRSPGFDDAAKPKTVVSLYEGQSTGDAMHAYARNLTVDVGAGNPGAAGLRFMANNTGAVYDVTVRSSDPQKAGAIGLDLTQSQNGPAFIKNVTVEGFDYGVAVHNTFSLVLEHIAVSDQRKAGFRNENGRVTVRDFRSRNSVTALENIKHGQLTLIGAELTGGAPTAAAITTDNGKIFLRDIKAQGYGATVKPAKGEPVTGNLAEWTNGETYAPLAGKATTLRLPIEETPEIAWETDLSKWVKVEPGPDGLQKALDAAAAAGKTTVYFPKIAEKGGGKYVLTAPVRVHGSVNRIIGMENILWIDEKLPVGATVFTFEDLKGPVVVERFFNMLKNGGWKGLKDRFLIENRSDQPLVLRNFAHGACDLKKPNPGKTLFIEDMATHLKIGKGEKCWARQLNPESPEEEMVVVDGGQLWILGLKTEGRSRHIVATGGAKVELLGGVSYQSWKNQKLDPPVFTVKDSEASFTIGFYHYNLPFSTIVEETGSGGTRTLSRKDLKDYHLPLYRSGPARP